MLPKRSVTIKDRAAYGIIVTQGYGRFGKLPVSTPSMIRFGQMTEDELFVSAAAAAEGVTIENLSESDPLVVLSTSARGTQTPSRCGSKICSEGARPSARLARLVALAKGGRSQWINAGPRCWELEDGVERSNTTT